MPGHAMPGQPTVCHATTGHPTLCHPTLCHLTSAARGRAGLRRAGRTKRPAQSLSKVSFDIQVAADVGAREPEFPRRPQCAAQRPWRAQHSGGRAGPASLPSHARTRTGRPNPAREAAQAIVVAASARRLARVPAAGAAAPTRAPPSATTLSASLAGAVIRGPG